MPVSIGSNSTCGWTSPQRFELTHGSLLRLAAMRSALAAALLGLCFAGCRGGTAEAPQSAAHESATPAPVSAGPTLPDDDAGRLVARAIEAAGGWESWSRHRDATFISTLTIFNPLGSAISETIFLHKLPLHAGVKTRVESIGIGDEIVFAFDGEREWMTQGGRVVQEPSRVAFTRFHALASAYWFALPFVLAELPGELTYLGSEEDGGRTWEKLRVGYADSVPLPFDWLVLYFDAETAKLDRVHVHALAEFLQHSLWVGVWREERQAGGVLVNRLRAFFASNPAAEIAGGMVSEQMVEHVEFDRGFSPELLEPPSARALTGQIES